MSLLVALILLDLHMSTHVLQMAEHRLPSAPPRASASDSGDAESTSSCNRAMSTRSDHAEGERPDSCIERSHA